MFNREFTARPQNNGVTGYQGLDGLVMESLINKMNITPRYVVPADGIQFGVKLDNGTITGALGEVVRKNSQIAGNSRFLTDYKTGDIEFSSTLYSERLCVVVPKHSKIPKSYMMWRVFQPMTWLCVLLLIFSSIIIIFIKNSLWRSPESSTLTETLAILGIMVNQSVSYRRSKKLLLLFSCFMFFAIISEGVYEGFLVKSFTSVSYYKDINTLEELAKSDLKIDTTLDVFDTDESPTVKELRKKKVDQMIDELSTYQEICTYKNVSTVARVSEITHLKYKVFLSRDGTRCLHAVTEYLLTYFVVYIVPLNSPYLYQINLLLTRLGESGFINHWFKSAYGGQATKAPRNAFEPIALKDVLIPFQILIIGYIFATLAFLYEVISKKLSRNSAN